MIRSLLLILELSFERVSGFRYRPDILWKPPACPDADQSALRSLTQEPLSDFPGNLPVVGRVNYPVVG